MEAINKPFEFTGVFVQDPHSKGFTAFFAQLPNIIVEGETEEEATTNLLETIRTVFEHQKNLEISGSNENVITKPFNVSFA